MRFFRLNSLGNRSMDRSLVCIDKRPAGLGRDGLKLTTGEPLAAIFPPEAEVHLRPSEPGRQLTDFLSNTQWLFIANRRTRDVVAQVCGSEGVEYLPFVLFDQAGARLSDDYAIIHPLSVCKAVNRAASTLTYEDEDDENSDITDVEEYVFDRDLVDGLPHLFRVPEFTYDIFIDEVLARALHGAKISNLVVREVEVR